MAAAFFNALADPSKARAVSAGTQPADRVNPVVVEAMREAGIDVSAATPQRLTPTVAEQASLLVTMGCGDECPYDARAAAGRLAARRSRRSAARARAGHPRRYPPAGSHACDPRGRRRNAIIAAMRILPFAMWIALAVLALAIAPRAADAPKQLIAHRGASGYAPEHTAAAYKLAIEQKADFIEPDLAVTKDNVLICLHDDTLERTTNVAEVFPDRASAATAATESTRRPGKHWLANDFTLAEIKRLDAGKWFNQKFAGEKILTFEEMIALVRGHGGIYPELKSPPLYTARGVDMEKIFVSVVKKLGLDTPASMKTMPVIIQSFDEATIRRVAADLPAIPRVFLTSSDEDVSDARLRELSKFSNGMAPEKFVIARHPEMVKASHALGMTVTSWTFKKDDDKMAFPTVRDEMQHFLYELGIDALFTNNPDQFPRR
jgi:glycerophosphoryl diester phosphodiesterase